MLRQQRGCRAFHIEVINRTDSGTPLERAAREGDRPVREIGLASGVYLSKTDHEEFCLKLGSPLSKAKYVIATDSERVP